MKHIIFSLLLCLSSFMAIGQSDSIAEDSAHVQHKEALLVQYKEAVLSLRNLMKENIRISEQQDSIYQEEYLKPRIKELDSLIQQAAYVQSDSTIQQVAERLNVSYGDYQKRNNTILVEYPNDIVGYLKCKVAYDIISERADKAYFQTYKSKDVDIEYSSISDGSDSLHLSRNYDLNDRGTFLLLSLGCEQGKNILMMMVLP